MNASRQRLLVCSAIFLWVAAISLGARELLHYSQTPGKLEVTPEMWPPAGGDRIADRPSLVLFLHPECPCSRATVRELTRVLTRTPRNLNLLVYFLQLDDENWSAENSTLWRSVARIPGAKLARDSGGKLAKHFGAHTSGTVLLYDKEGRLRFRGGITGSRGQEGNNASAEALLASFREDKIQPVSTNVFGCSLF